MSKANAINFWKSVQDRYPHKSVETHIANLGNNKIDWFRNFGLANIAIARHCKFGRMGFDDNGYAEGQKFVKDVLRENNLSESMMQN